MVGVCFALTVVGQEQDADARCLIWLPLSHPLFFPSCEQDRENWLVCLEEEVGVGSGEESGEGSGGCFRI